MKPIQPEELSAFLDGELSAQRTREVQQQLDSDDVLRDQIDSLQGLDQKLRAAAFDARFKPSIRLPSTVEPASRVLGIAALGAVLAGLRLTLKMVDVEVLQLMAVNAAVLAVLLAATAWLIRRDVDDDHGLQ
jgi:anti-sigma factor RsiW